MRRKISLLILIVLPAFLIAQDNQKLKSVKKVIVSNGILLEIVRSDDYTLDIKSPTLNVGCLIHTIENGVLTLKIKSDFNCKGEVTALLKIPEIKEIVASNKAEVSTNNVLKTDSLKIKLRTGSKAFIDLDVKYLNCSLSEGSVLTAEGYAISQQVSVTTKATYSAFNLEGENLNVTATANGTAKVCSTDSLKARANTGAYIGYKCSPQHTNLDDSMLGTIEAQAD